jgi:hypothetical protein
MLLTFFYSCIDVDECASSIADCSQNCVNVVGSFNCECEFGYNLEDDRKTCIEGRELCTFFKVSFDELLKYISKLYISIDCLMQNVYFSDGCLFTLSTSKLLVWMQTEFAE